MPEARRIQLQPAYVLHHRPYRDSSRILELFTRDYGRVTVFARGARGGVRKGDSLMSMLQPFNRLLASWQTGGEAGTLTAAEFDGAYTSLPPARLVSGYYLNELLLKLFARHDTHTDVFTLYANALEALKVEAAPLRVLRIFEKRLLEALGYGLALEHEAGAGAAIESHRSYQYRIEQGATAALDGADSAMVFSGASLLSLASEDLSDAVSCQDARRLLRAALDHCLEGKELKSRTVMLALRRNRGES